MEIRRQSTIISEDPIQGLKKPGLVICLDRPKRQTAASKEAKKFKEIPYAQGLAFGDGTNLQFQW